MVANEEEPLSLLLPFVSIEKVLFSENEMPWKKMMLYFPNLKGVVFQYISTDEFLLYVSKFCSNIETIDVQFSRVSDEGLKHLCLNENGEAACPALKKLFIQYTEVQDKGIKYLLKNLPSLEKVDYRKLPLFLYSFHKNEISTIYNVKCYNLTHLNLMSTVRNQMFDDVIKVCVIVCPHLKSLSSPVFKQEHLDLCSKLHKLQKLYLDCCNEFPLELNGFLRLRGNGLTSLRISNFLISLSLLAQNCPSLNSLHMEKISFQHNVSDSLPVFHNLERIIVENIILIDPGNTLAVSCILSSNSNLNQLSFINCNLLSSEIKTQILKLSEQCKLKMIDFSGSDIELMMLEDILLTCPTLKCVILDGCDLARDTRAMDQLRNFAFTLPNLPELYLDELLNPYGEYFDADAPDDDEFDYVYNLDI